MTPEDRAALREAASKATPHPNGAPCMTSAEITQVSDARRDMLRFLGPAAVLALLDAADERDKLRAENERLRGALASIEEYWNGAEASAVDAAEECRYRARAALEASR